MAVRPAICNRRPYVDCLDGFQILIALSTNLSWTRVSKTCYSEHANQKALFLCDLWRSHEPTFDSQCCLVYLEAPSREHSARGFQRPLWHLNMQSNLQLPPLSVWHGIARLDNQVVTSRVECMAGDPRWFLRGSLKEHQIRIFVYFLGLVLL